MCPLCNEDTTSADDTRLMYNSDGTQADAHRECMLRSVMGGIGHLIAHEYWCTQHSDPDAGLTYHQSARLVDAYYHIVGFEIGGEPQP